MALQPADLSVGELEVTIGIMALNVFAETM